MAILLPALGACKGITPGERRCALRLQQKLEDDYLVWYDVPVGPANAHPDFVVLHPRRGILILEVKDWKRDTIVGGDKTSFEINTNQGRKHVANPLEQARHYAHAVADALKKDPQLIFADGKLMGQLLFPWSYGVCLPNITRRDFDEGGLNDVIPANRVICKDEMTESVDEEAFQQRLWEMFTLRFKGALSLPQIDRIRWHMFPEFRIAPRQADLGLVDDDTPLVAMPDLMQVMDLQQEQLARSLGDGHRVVHGVAGSGKTLILGYRALHLAAICVKPILILCYNRKLADKLAYLMKQNKCDDKVVVKSFHQWCHAQLTTYNIGLPTKTNDDKFFADMVDRVIGAVDQAHIPSGQYDAVLIDEGHDFKPEWFKLVVQMVNPASQSLLVLYDDAQSIYQKTTRHKFSFKSVGIEAQGRTTVFKINYRNTKEILRVAQRFAADLLTAHDTDEDHVPTVSPVAIGRSGVPPLFIQLPTLADENTWIVNHLKTAHEGGMPWHNMAVLYREYAPTAQSLLKTLAREGVPATWQKQMQFAPSQDSVKIISMHSSKGLEFPLVVIAGLGHIAPNVEEEPEEARLLYVAMTRATHTLVMTADGETKFTERVRAAVAVG